MKTYDVGIGWANPVDQEFVRKLKNELRQKNFSCKEITYINLRHSISEIDADKINFKYYIDRSSEDYAAYLHIASVLKGRGTRVLNDPHTVIYYLSKAHLHDVYTRVALPTVPTIVLHPRKNSKEQCARVVKQLGVPFVLKPSYGGGGEGVVINARTENDILDFFDKNPTDECIAQSYIVPRVLMERAAWFRPIFACGEVLPLWWDPKNHFYHEFGNMPVEKVAKGRIVKYMEYVAELTGLSLFSSEILVNKKGEYQFLDPANYPIDLNTQENVPDGLPAKVLEKIVKNIVAEVGR